MDDKENSMLLPKSTRSKLYALLGSYVSLMRLQKAKGDKRLETRDIHFLFFEGPSAQGPQSHLQKLPQRWPPVSLFLLLPLGSFLGLQFSVSPFKKKKMGRISGFSSAFLPFFWGDPKVRLDGQLQLSEQLEAPSDSEPSFGVLRRNQNVWYVWWCLFKWEK